jgi:hypothetical protein
VLECLLKYCQTLSRKYSGVTISDLGNPNDAVNKKKALQDLLSCIYRFSKKNYCLYADAHYWLQHIIFLKPQ